MSDAVGYSVLDWSARPDYAAHIVRLHMNEDMALCDLE
jgi:predicted acetyltransferase